MKTLEIKSRKITLEEFRSVCIKEYTVKNVASFYGCGTTTISNKIKECFPDLPRQSRTPIGFKLLALESKMKCYKCGKVKDYKEFSNNSYTKNGLTKECKECNSIYSSSDKKKLINKQYRQTLEGKNLHKFNQQKRELNKERRTPPWADLQAIKEFYINCPEGYHVDHIIPLQGKTVSGLHVLENLQYLTAEENLKKSNKFIPN